MIKVELTVNATEHHVLYFDTVKEMETFFETLDRVSREEFTFTYETQSK